MNFTGLEQAFGALTEPIRAYVKVGKVLSVHREDHSVDVQFLDGGPTAKVPVLCGWIGSNFGAVHLTAPTYDKEELARKTYPDAPPDMAVSPANESKTGRDIYAVVLQAEGGFLGTAGMWVIGFEAPQVSEMLFARDDMSEGAEPGNGTFADMLLLRHPSDAQAVIDRYAKLTYQHPAGTRLAIGENIDKTHLKKKDYDQRYQLRHNITRYASFLLRAIGPGGIERATVRGLVSGLLELFAFATILLINKLAFITIDAGGNIVLSTHGGRAPVTEEVEDGQEPSGADSGPGNDIRLESVKDIIETAVKSILMTAGTNIEGSAGEHIGFAAPRIDLN